MSEAIAAYNALLSDELLGAESAGVLQGGQAQRNLFFGRHPLCTSLRPNLLDRARYDAVVAASEAVYDAMAALETVLLADADLRAQLDLDPDEERLALADPGCTAASPSSRLDGFFSDELRYVEYNAETPAGMAYEDNLAAVFETLPVMREFREQFRLTPLPLRQPQLATMLRAFREWGGARDPVIAIVDWAGLPTLSEFQLFREFFESQGVPTHIAEPEGLDFHDGALYADGNKVNLIYKRVLATELIGSGTESYQPLRDAYLAGAVCCVNTFRAKLLDKKMTLALLSDERYASLYSPPQRQAIARHVPWTRMVREGPTTRHGQEIPDLVAYLCTHRHDLVLKPNDDYGGKGVVLGWTVDDHEWEQAVVAAQLQSYVVQEAVPAPKEAFPVALRENVSFLDLTVDLDPYLYYGKVEGCLTRLSSSALLNVTAGTGSVVPTYVVEAPPEPSPYWRRGRSLLTRDR